MQNLIELDKIKFRKFIRDNWPYIVREISMETSISKKYVEEILDSLHCYILFTEKDKDICPLSRLKKCNNKGKIRK